MSELEGEIAVPQLALVMCLSLWAYYIQIKGGFTDRRQAPAPASNQTLPSGEPCGAAHMWPQPRSVTPPRVLQWFSTEITEGVGGQEGGGRDGGGTSESLATRFSPADR